MGYCTCPSGKPLTDSMFTEGEMVIEWTLCLHICTDQSEFLLLVGPCCSSSRLSISAMGDISGASQLLASCDAPQCFTEHMLEPLRGELNNLFHREKPSVAFSATFFAFGANCLRDAKTDCKSFQLEIFKMVVWEIFAIQLHRKQTKEYFSFFQIQLSTQLVLNSFSSLEAWGVLDLAIVPQHSFEIIFQQNFTIGGRLSLQTFRQRKSIIKITKGCNSLSFSLLETIIQMGKIPQHLKSSFRSATLGKKKKYNLKST